MTSKELLYVKTIAEEKSISQVKASFYRPAILKPGSRPN